MFEHKNLLAAALLCGLSLFSCQDKTEPIPAYLRIEPFKVDAEGGAGWQDLSDAWVYINREFLGAYTLPHTLPVLADGDTEIWVLPGVKENGILETPSVNYFFKRYETTQNLKPGETLTLQPSTAYDVPSVSFPWEVSRTTFDGPSSVVYQDRDNDLDVNLRFTTEGAFAGRSMLMAVDSAHAEMLVVSEPVILPVKAERITWLEVHHRSDMPFTLWLIGKGENEPEQTPTAIYSFNKTENDGWNKIYINLTDFLQQSGKKQHLLMFRAALPKDATGKFTQSKGAVRLDNIRLVHF